MDAAATKARELMIANSISQTDLESYSEAGKRAAWIIQNHKVYTLHRKFAIYDDYVASAVDAICDTRNYVEVGWDDSRGLKRTWTRRFVGAEDDVAVAGELFMVLLDQLRRMARQTCGAGWDKRHNSYGYGWSSRIRERALSMKMALPEQSLVQQLNTSLVIRDKQQQVTSWITANLKLSPAKRRTIRVTDDYHTGRQHAENVDLGNPKRRLS